MLVLCTDGGISFALPFEIQRLGRSVVETGPTHGAVAGSRRVRRARLPVGISRIVIPAAILCGFGLIAFSAGLAFLALFPENGSAFDLIWRMALLRAGFWHCFQAPNSRTMMISAPRARSGAAAGMLSTVRALGHTSGAAIVALLFSTHMNGGAKIALTAAAVMAAIAALLSFSRLRTPR